MGMSTESAFRFGKRWRYNSKYRDNEGADHMNGGRYAQWFVSQKYRDLQREMLSNSLKQIPMTQWRQLTSKAAQFLKSSHLKALRSWKAIRYDDKGSHTTHSKAIPALSVNSAMEVRHVTAILIYCNFTDIKNALSDAYSP